MKIFDDLLEKEKITIFSDLSNSHYDRQELQKFCRVFEKTINLQEEEFKDVYVWEATFNNVPIRETLDTEHKIITFSLIKE
jgi:hypothetical protein